MTSERKSELLRHALTAGGFGSGAGAIVVLAQALAAKPEMLITTISNFGPWFMVAMCGMFFVDRRVGEGIRILRENASSQQRLADAVQAIAHRDDDRAREQDLVINELARRQERTLEMLSAIEQRLPKPHARSAGAD